MAAPEGSVTEPAIAPYVLCPWTKGIANKTRDRERIRVRNLEYHISTPHAGYPRSTVATIIEKVGNSGDRPTDFQRSTPHEIS
jgi:hypothetical protein